MAIELPALPYADDALAPHISAETISFHYGKHHAAYVNNLNGMLEDGDDRSLEDIITSAEGGMFNNAAQVWNHTFYWNCMSPNGGGAPTGAVGEAIDSAALFATSSRRASSCLPVASAQARADASSTSGA